MAYNPEAENWARNVLEQRRQIAASRAAAKAKEIAGRVPAFDGLERERRNIGVLRMRASLLGDEETVAVLSEKQKDISRRLEEALKQYGYSLSDLEVKHACEKCGDTGTLADGRDCSCKKAIIRDHLIRKLNESSPLALCSFDTFDLSLYGTEPDPATKVAPRTVMKSNLEKCRKFVRDFPACDNLLMTGGSGLGKTHLALSIASELLKKDAYVIYCSAAGVFNRIDGEKSDFSRSSYTLDSMKECDLLVLDDLGTEYLNANTLSSIYDLINSRISEKKPTIITSNLDSSRQISARYGEKISSRLFGCFRLLPFFGEDIRLKKNGLTR